MDYPAKRGWTEIKSGRIYNLYMEACEEVFKYNLWDPKMKDIPKLYSHKSTRSLGTCYTKKYYGELMCAICLSEYILSMTDDQIRKTICHELGHACRPDDHHGYRWYSVAAKIGLKWNYIPSRLNGDEEISTALNEVRKAIGAVYKYELFCPCCGATWKYKSRCAAIQHPSRYRCHKDKTTLQSRQIVFD